MEAQVQNATLKIFEDFKIPTKSITIQGNQEVNKNVKELYLRKIGVKYFIY